jgi:hypothetical protein
MLLIAKTDQTTHTDRFVGRMQATYVHVTGTTVENGKHERDSQRCVSLASSRLNAASAVAKQSTAKSKHTRATLGATSPALEKKSEAGDVGKKKTIVDVV